MLETLRGTRAPWGSDEDAYMALALNNAQGELHPLEEGMHAIGSGLSVREYAAKIGRSHTTLQDKIQAARVIEACTHLRTEAVDQWQQSL